MTQSIRQRNLFAAEDYRIAYESFRQANFQAYDFDSIRAAILDYVRQQYPENYNDWIGSSEFVAIIETLAFLSHSLAFRIDQAGRENFLSTAERRSSVLRIADFLGYTPTRHQPARGELKIVGIRTTQDVYDISGRNLKNISVDFEDAYQNFLLVLNEMLPSVGKFGRPTDSTTIGSIRHDVYSTNTSLNDSVAFQFNGQINGIRRRFEAHGIEINSTTNSLQETEPNHFGNFGIVYKNDGQGIGSPSTGFFVGFKQGHLQFTDINADRAIPNFVLNMSATNVNESDVWLQEINDAGEVQATWTKVNSGFGANAIFNSIQQNRRKIYAVKTAEDDNIILQFGDGVFSDIPRGNLRVWFRTGLDQTYTLNPEDLGTISISMRYTDARGDPYTMTFDCELQEPVSNASSQESISSIKNNAGRVFASQDRMITADDYSVFPMTVSENVRKIKAVNRTYAGHSRFVKPQDPTATYQSVDMNADDGYLYTENVIHRSTLPLPSSLTSEQIYERFIAETIENPEVINLFYNEYPLVAIDSDLTDRENSYEWQQVTQGYRGSTGYITRNGLVQGSPLSNIIDDGMSSIALRQGSIIEFVEDPYTSGGITNPIVVNGGTGYTTAPTVMIRSTGTGSGATATAIVTNGIVTGITIDEIGSGYKTPPYVELVGGGGSGAVITVGVLGSSPREWARVVSVSNDGQGIINNNGRSTGLAREGQGAIVLNRAIPNTARISRIFPAYNINFSTEERNAILEKLEIPDSFGIRFDHNTGRWMVIDISNLPAANQNNPSNFSLSNAGIANDNSWIVRANYSADEWQFVSRRLRYVFGSEEQIRFYNQNGRQKFNTETNKPERDRITIRGINTGPNGSQQPIGTDLTFFSHRYYTETDGHTDDHKVIVSLADIDNDNYPDDPLAFKNLVGGDMIKIGRVNEDGFSYRILSDSGEPQSGRKDLSFRWRRISSSNYRIDPSISNVVDIFVLNQNYDTNYRKWISDDRLASTKPQPPSEADLEKQFAALDTKKAIGDSIVYRPAEYKIIFGELADIELQGKFNVIKVTGTSFTDNEIKSRLLDIVNEFFDIDNWDFGETFYFTELSAFIHQKMPAIISSVVIVPIQSNSAFGRLFQIVPESNELFIPDITLQDIDIVDSLDLGNA